MPHNAIIARLQRSTMPGCGRHAGLRRAGALPVLLLVAALAPVQAQEVSVRNGHIGWVPGRLPNRAYFEVVNGTRKPVTLVGARSPHFARIEFKAAPDNDLFILEPLDMPQVIRPDETLAFRPGGPYLLLLVQSDWMEPGRTATITLLFSDHAPVHAELPIRK